MAEINTKVSKMAVTMNKYDVIQRKSTSVVSIILDDTYQKCPILVIYLYTEQHEWVKDKLFLQ